MREKNVRTHTGTHFPICAGASLSVYSAVKSRGRLICAVLLPRLLPLALILFHSHHTKANPLFLLLSLTHTHMALLTPPPLHLLVRKAATDSSSRGDITLGLVVEILKLLHEQLWEKRNKQ